MNYPKHRYTGEKPWMDRDWLYNEYVINDRRTADIANEYGCKQNTINCWLIKHGIKKDVKTHIHIPKYKYENAEYLYDQHITKHKSMSEIAKENNVSSDAIRYNLQKFNIPIWSAQNKRKYTDADVDLMVDLYCNQNMSANQISKIFCTSHNVIIKQLQSRGIKTRNTSEAQYNFNGKELPNDFFNPELLYKLHWENNLTCKQIGQLYNVNASTVRRQMKKIGVRTKNNSESKIGLMVGEKHPNWKGGVSSLYDMLREYFNTNQAPVIAKRDNYTCQLCGKTHTILHVHHIVHFSDIVWTIISEHPDLSIDNVDERLKLYDVITHDKRFLDDNNLVTLCKDCHFYKVHNYKQKTISSEAS